MKEELFGQKEKTMPIMQAFDDFEEDSSDDEEQVMEISAKSCEKYRASLPPAPESSTSGGRLNNKDDINGVVFTCEDKMGVNRDVVSDEHHLFDIDEVQE